MAIANAVFKSENEAWGIYYGARVTVTLESENGVNIKIETCCDGTFTRISKENHIQADIKNLSYNGMKNVAKYFSTVLCPEISELAETAYRAALAKLQS